MVYINLNSKKEKHKHTQQEFHKLDNNALEQFQQQFNNQAAINATTLSEAINRLKDEMLRTLKERPNQNMQRNLVRCGTTTTKKNSKNIEHKWLKYREDHQGIAFKRERNRYNRMIKFKK